MTIITVTTIVLTLKSYYDALLIPPPRNLPVPGCRPRGFLGVQAFQAQIHHRIWIEQWPIVHPENGPLMVVGYDGH